MSSPNNTSRRNFLRYASLAAAAGPMLGEAHFARAAQQITQQAADLYLRRQRAAARPIRS